MLNGLFFVKSPSFRSQKDPLLKLALKESLLSRVKFNLSDDFLYAKIKVKFMFSSPSHCCPVVNYLAFKKIIRNIKEKESQKNRVKYERQRELKL